MKTIQQTITIDRQEASSDLERLEDEINSEALEAFYHIGQKLLVIRKRELYREAGFKSWSAYCSSGRIDFGKRQADNYIRASELRPKLGNTVSHEFTQREVLELCKCETDNDARRVAKKAATIASKQGKRVTAKLIAQVRDGDDETAARSRRQCEQLQAASLDTHISNLADLIVDYRKSLERVESEQWSEASANNISRLKREATLLIELLNV